MKMKITDDISCINTTEILLEDEKNIEIDGYVIELSIQKTGFGQRHLFICPGCQKRVMRLYIQNYQAGYFCRKCSNLTYHSSQWGISSNGTKNTNRYPKYYHFII